MRLLVRREQLWWATGGNQYAHLWIEWQGRLFSLCLPFLLFNAGRALRGESADGNRCPRCLSLYAEKRLEARWPPESL